MKNYEELLRRCATWLRPGGRLFVHIFAHRRVPYHFESRSADDWMARYFFSGGTMPSLDLLLYFQRDLSVVSTWYVNGRHYSRTLEAWLRNHDRHRRRVLALFERAYGAGRALKWFVYWRLFYLACSELFAFNGGEEWGVGLYLFAKPGGEREGAEGGKAAAAAAPAPKPAVAAPAAAPKQPAAAAPPAMTAAAKPAEAGGASANGARSGGGGGSSAGGSGGGGGGGGGRHRRSSKGGGGANGKKSPAPAPTAAQQ